MGKKINFWIGVFVTLIAGMPLVLILSDAIPNGAMQIFSLSIGFIFGLILLALIVLLFGETLLKKLTNKPREKLNEIARLSVEAISQARRGETDRALGTSEKLVQPLLSWIIWAQFYRWIIGTMVALLVVAGTFAGTILLAEQNEKFDVQNALASVDLTDSIRNIILENIPQSKKGDLSGRTLALPGCQMTVVPEVPLRGVANSSTLENLKSLAQNEDIREQVVSSLKYLLKDDSGSVVLSALLVLDSIGETLDSEPILVQDYRSTDWLNVSAKVDLIFSNSLASVHCRECIGLTFRDSYVLQSQPQKIGAINSILFNSYGSEEYADPANFWNNIIITQPDEELEQAVLNSKIELNQNVFFYFTESTNVSSDSSLTLIEERKRLGDEMGVDFSCFSSATIRVGFCESNNFVVCE